MLKPDKPRQYLFEALVLALPFLALILAYGLVTGKISFSQWPPIVEMRAAFWIPVIFCAITYFYVLLNLYYKRRGNWIWYREGLISGIILVVLWCILAPMYDHSLWSVERSKVGMSHP
jgi:hypothetical protein